MTRHQQPAKVSRNLTPQELGAEIHDLVKEKRQLVESHRKLRVQNALLAIASVSLSGILAAVLVSNKVDNGSFFGK